MKKLLLVITIIAMGFTASAQEKDKFRFGMDAGYAFTDGGDGLFGYLEPKYNLTDNSNVGLRIGGAVRGGNAESLNIKGIGSFLGTYDYYFSNNTSSSPFVGGGLGVYWLGSIDDLDFDLGTQFGGMIRGGIELSKFRITLEYNIIPKSDLPIGQSIKNSYFGASLGFYLGGGKWKK
ncbi:hypothetical protein [Eudoraea adriatica]|uniref:hypothetical protein n=1 Tax=Eudoraea adriatica TaxID=446681 RepID=UPI000362F2F4|nr:hypothetical protein [Eudoraea adriatica]